MAVVAYLAEGKLFVVEGEGASPRAIESDFVQQMLDRAQRDRQRNDWKQGSAGWQATAMPPEMAGLASMVPAEDAHRRAARMVAIGDAAAPGRLLYALVTQSIGGLFEYELEGGYERRLVHKEALQIRDVTRRADGGELAWSIGNNDGSANLAVSEAEGGRQRVITEGDSVDEAPRWAPGACCKLVFQSAGIGRDGHGMLWGLGPYRVETLDLDSGEHEVLLEDDARDYLQPQLLPDGTLLCIERPYKPDGYSARTWKTTLRDMVMTPVVLFHAVVGFLDLFAKIFAKKPLISAGGPERRGLEARAMLLWGRRVEAQRREQTVDAGKALVPGDWRLIRRGTDGAMETIAEHVGAFDAGPDDRIVFTDGSAIYECRHGQPPRRLATGTLIEKVAIIRS